MALRELGCRLELMALRGHPARVTGVFERIYQYDPLRPMASLRGAIVGGEPEFVIPADELALMHVGEMRREIEGLVDRSVGGRAVMEAAESRMTLMRIAAGEGVAVPETMEIVEEADLEEAMARFGLPLVLKADATSGGQGVRVMRDPRSARRAWGLLHRPPGLVRALKRGFVDKEWTHLRPWAQRKKRGVSAQRFIAGKERTGMAMCVRGAVKAMVCLEVIEHWCERGPSSVVRIIEDAAMERAMCLVARRVGVSGFCGFDFIVEPEGGRALLIEMNPRPTQLAHLALGPGRDLVAAYVREVLGVAEVEDRGRVTASETIAVFPLELQRDSESQMIRTGFHDVPWDSPALVRKALKVVPRVLTEDTRWRETTV